MSEHCLIPGDFFTPEQWLGPMAPWVDRLVTTPGGVLMIAVDVAPERRNYPLVSFAVFDAQERKALRAALLRSRKKREAVPERPQKAFKRAVRCPDLPRETKALLRDRGIQETACPESNRQSGGRELT